MYGGLEERERERRRKRGRGVTAGLLSTGDNRSLRARLVQPLIVSVGVRGLMVGGLEILCTWRTCSEAQNQSHAESMYAYLCESVCVNAYNGSGSNLSGFSWCISAATTLCQSLSPVNSVTRDQSTGYSELSSNRPYSNNPFSHLISHPFTVFTHKMQNTSN